MPTPPSQLKIVLKSSTATNAGEKVKVTNLTRSGTIYSVFDADKGCIIEPKDEGQTNWESGDSVIAEVHGRLQGYGTGTLATKGVTISLTTSADADTTGYATVNVNL